MAKKEYTEKNILQSKILCRENTNDINIIKQLRIGYIEKLIIPNNSVC